MARRFRGTSDNKVDSKGRVSIPAAFRRVLEEGDPDWAEGLNPNVVLVFGGKSQKFIEGYTMKAMEEVDDQISALQRGSRDRRILETLFTGQSVQLQVDETGRLVLSQKLRDKFGITSKAVFVGAVDTFQIWEPAAHEVHKEKLEGWIEDVDEDEDFDPLTLLPPPKPTE